MQPATWNVPLAAGGPAATGSAGQIARDDSYFYLCTATDTWKPVALATW